MEKAIFIVSKQILASMVLRGAKIQNDHGEFTVEVGKGSESYDKLLEIGAKEIEASPE